MSLNVNLLKASSERNWPTSTQLNVFDRSSSASLGHPAQPPPPPPPLPPPTTSQLAAIGNYQRRLIAATENRERRRMENSSYVPTSLQSPALMVLTSASDSSDASMQMAAAANGASPAHSASVHPPTTSLSFSEPKEVAPFTSSSFAALPHVPPSLYGHVPDGFANLSAAHLLHMHAPFLAPNMDRALGFINPTGGGAFRPVTSAAAAAAANGFYSAFVSAAKCPKLEHNVLHQHGQQLRGLGHALHAQTLRGNSGQGGLLTCSPTSGNNNVKLTGGSVLSSAASSAAAAAFHDNNNGGGRMGLSPVHIKDEGSSDATSSDFNDRLTGTPCSDVTDGTERSTPDEVRDKRKKTSQFAGQSPCCPVCGVTIRCGEFEVHFIQEIERLSKISRLVRRNPRENMHKDSSTSNRSICSSSSSTSSSSNSSNNNNANKKCKDSPNQGTEKMTTPESRWESYQRIRTNRQGRLGARSKLKKRRHADEAICPVCCERVIGTPEELNAHAEQCLRKRDIHGGGEEDEPVDVEGETYEEYEWAGQTRIRATSLLEGGYAASGFHTANSRTQKDEDDDVDLNVDGDDSATYGQAQYPLQL